MAVPEPWYVLLSKPREETLLARYARACGPEVFLTDDSGETGQPAIPSCAPLLPGGDLFVCTDLAQLGESAFRWMPLSQGLVCVGSEPASVPQRGQGEARQSRASRGCGRAAGRRVPTR